MKLLLILDHYTIYSVIEIQNATQVPGAEEYLTISNKSKSVTNGFDRLKIVAYLSRKLVIIISQMMIDYSVSGN